MEIKEKIKGKIKELISSGSGLKQGDEHGQVRNETHSQSCVGWLASAQNITYLVVGNSKSPYKKSIDKICDEDQGYCVNQSVGEVSMILESLLLDIESGLLTPIEDHIKATVFGDFLDHAKEYANKKNHREAGVIAGVVFEDTVRAVCRNQNMEEKGVDLESLISQLVKDGTLSQAKAKRARVAAHVRTKATHAQWDEFELDDVKATIVFTEELIKSFGEIN